jgi:hypothetical protein
VVDGFHRHRERRPRPVPRTSVADVGPVRVTALGPRARRRRTPVRSGVSRAPSSHRSSDRCKSLTRDPPCEMIVARSPRPREPRHRRGSCCVDVGSALAGTLGLDRPVVGDQLRVLSCRRTGIWLDSGSHRCASSCSIGRHDRRRPRRNRWRMGYGIRPSGRDQTIAQSG